MEVIKRDGRRERIELDKITNRIGSLWRKEPQLNQLVDPVNVKQIPPPQTSMQAGGQAQLVAR